MTFVDQEFSTNTSGVAPIIFDPTVGFILDNTIDKNKSIDGEYKCLTAEKDDVVTVQVVPEQIPNPENHAGKYKLDKRAKLFYNETTQQFVCCSNTDKPPNIFIFYCMSYVHCRIATPLIYHNVRTKFIQHPPLIPRLLNDILPSILTQDDWEIDFELLRPERHWKLRFNLLVPGGV